ncbi:uncharacterized protein LOC103715425 [Phoenix dactylifera]|uniref:Uncharacterized protein LOC103715425 n=1 Tax=Phoenix dactylifera TaxID=42345 RepID=A0A8B7CKW1_PHODC|nr:uncharacterized protein LOC103715425 [Phoenix dactylifera]
MWRGARLAWRSSAVRRFSSNVRRLPEDEGDWSYSSEWWGTSSDGRTVFRSTSDYGNGVVSVVSYPCSRPAPMQWPTIERWLEQRYAKSHPEFEHDGKIRILGYEWRVLSFNGNTRQSTAKTMVTYRKSDPASLYLMQQPHCLAVPYLKSMVSAGLITLTSSTYDLPEAVIGKRTMNILCIGHGGGSLPLFLASKIKGAVVHIVDIDPVVISASIQAMGFPASAVKTADQISVAPPAHADRLLWDGIHDRLFLHRSDAEDFVLNNPYIYDLVFIDAYDGDDIFPRKLWDSDGPFLRSLENRLHPAHGTVVVNLHSDSEGFATDANDCSFSDSILPMSRYVSQVCRAYKEHLGLAFCVPVPWLCNATLVACRGTGLCAGEGLFVNRDMVLNTLISKSRLVETVLDLPFPCLQYVKGGFVLVD